MLPSIVIDFDCQQINSFGCSCLTGLACFLLNPNRVLFVNTSIPPPYPMEKQQSLIKKGQAILASVSVCQKRARPCFNHTNELCERHASLLTKAETHLEACMAEAEAEAEPEPEPDFLRHVLAVKIEIVRLYACCGQNTEAVERGEKLVALLDEKYRHFSHRDDLVSAAYSHFFDRHSSRRDENDLSQVDYYCTILEQLAECYRLEGWYEKAICYCQKYLQLYVAFFGNRDDLKIPECVFAIRGKMAQCLIFLNHIDRGIELARESLCLCERQFSNHHPSTLKLKLDLAVYLVKEKAAANLVEAEKHLLDCLELQDCLVVKDSVSGIVDQSFFCMVKYVLAKTCRAKGMLQKAISLQKECIAGWRNRPQDLSQLIFSLRTLSQLYVENRCYKDALAVARECYSLCKRKFGKNDIQTLKSQYIVMIRSISVKDYRGALFLAKENYQLRKKVLGRNDVDTLIVAYFISLLRVEISPSQKTFREGSLVGITCLRALQRTYGKEDARTIDTQATVAFWFSKIKKFDMAIMLAEECLFLQHNRLGPNHPTVLAMQDTLVNYKRQSLIEEERKKNAFFVFPFCCSGWPSMPL